MAKWNNLAKRLPRFSVGTLFVVMTCCAVGMAVGTSPPKEQDVQQFFNFYIPQLNWPYAFLATASCLLIVELWRQQRRLRLEFRTLEHKELRDYSRFPIIARRMVALMLTILLIVVMLVQSNVLVLREHEELNLLNDELFPQVTWYVTFFLALSLAAPRQEPTKHGKCRVAIDGIVTWVGGIVLLFYLASQFYLVAFLVHLATEGIEKWRALRRQMPDAFPSHRQEGWFTFYASLAAFIAVLIALKCFLSLSQSKQSNRNRLIILSAFASSLAASAFYCAWFYLREYHRVSPYLADTVGQPTLLRDWLGSALIVAMMTVAWAHSWAGADVRINPITVSLTPVRASGLLLLATVPILISVGLLVTELVRMVLSFSFFQAPTIVDVFQYIFADPILLLQVASGLLAVQIAWRWLRRGAPEIVIQPIEPRRVFWAWLGLVGLVIVGIPVVAAFGFCWWLGPWYL